MIVQDIYLTFLNFNIIMIMMYEYFDLDLHVFS
jgi:hypothetical protein